MYFAFFLTVQALQGRYQNPTRNKCAVSSTSQVSNAFRKTAANFHYEFNMRHLTNVFEGLLKAHPKNFVQGEQLVHLWLHESERVYGDRLVSLARSYYARFATAITREEYRLDGRLPI